MLDWTHNRLSPVLKNKRVIIVHSVGVGPLYAELPNEVTKQRAVTDLFRDHPNLKRKRDLFVDVIERFLG